MALPHSKAAFACQFIFTRADQFDDNLPVAGSNPATSLKMYSKVLLCMSADEQHPLFHVLDLIKKLTVTTSFMQELVSRSSRI